MAHEPLCHVLVDPERLLDRDLDPTTTTIQD
jgi:hypothetical protein